MKSPEPDSSSNYTDTCLMNLNVSFYKISLIYFRYNMANMDISYK